MFRIAEPALAEQTGNDGRDSQLPGETICCDVVTGERVPARRHGWHQPRASLGGVLVDLSLNVNVPHSWDFHSGDLAGEMRRTE